MKTCEWKQLFTIYASWVFNVNGVKTGDVTWSYLLRLFNLKKKTFEVIMGEGPYWIVHQVVHILYTRWSMQCRPIIICTWIYFDFPQGWHRWGSLLRLFNLYKNLGSNHGRGSILNSSPTCPCSPLHARFIITCLWAW